MFKMGSHFSFQIWNISYGQKKGRESTCQFDSQCDSRLEKVGNRPDLLRCRRRATYHWKDLDESYNFALDSTLNTRSARKVMGLQSRRSPRWRDFGTPTQESQERKAIWMWPPWPATQYTIRGKVVASPKSGPWWILCVRVARGSS